MAILLGALIMHGLPVGPTLLVEHSDIIYMLIIAMTASKFIAPFLVWGIAKQSSRLTRLRPTVFTPIIAIAALVGTYVVARNIMDVVIALVFAYVGYAMRRYGFSRIAFIIAFALGETVERTLFQTLNTFGSFWPVLSRPISGTLVVLCIVILLFAARQGWNRMRRSAEEVSADAAYEEELPQLSRPQPGRLVFTGLLLVGSLVLVLSAWSLHSDASVMPLLVGGPLVAGLTALFVLEARPTWRPIGARGKTTPPAPQSPQPEAVKASSSVGSREAQASGGVVDALVQVENASRQESTSPADRRMLHRQAAFSAWALGFVGISAVVGFSVGIPIALFFFLLVLGREPVVKSAVITAGTWLFIYGMFDLALGVSLS
jgi:hypothetical protein